MHILVVTQYFWPENFRINDLVSGLVASGHRVTVLTGIPNYPEGRFFTGYGIFSNTSQEYQGAKVVRVPLIPRGKGGGVRLALNYISFVLSACLFAPFNCRENYDVIFVCGLSPVTVALPALFLKSFRKIPVMFWVQDLWPESLAATGAVTSIRMLDFVAGMVRWIYLRCDKILVTSRAFRESVEKLGGASKDIIYFPQSAEDVFQLSIKNEMPKVLNTIPKGFWIMFAGNIGAAQDFETIISAAEKLKSHENIHWIIVGDGRLRDWAETQVQARKLFDNFHFLGRYPLEAMPTFFSYADVMLVTLKREPIFALTIPAKIQSYLACGRPIVAALDGEGALIVNESGAGFVSPPKDSDGLAQAVLRMSAMAPEQRRSMGEMGRNYYKAHFDRNMLLAALLEWMDELVQPRKSKGNSIEE